MNDPRPINPAPARFSWWGFLARGVFAGVLAGVVMLLCMTILRSLFGVPTPTEMIFDRLFPLLTVKLFIGALVKAGGYTPLKLQGVFGALAGQLAVAGLGGLVYALFMRRRASGAGWSLVVPGVLAAWLLFVGLLWPQLLTSFRGLPPHLAWMVTVAGMLLDFAVCGGCVAAFHRLLLGDDRAATTTPPRTGTNLGRRTFLATGLGAGASVVLGAMLYRLYRLGTFFYDGREYKGPGVQRITPVVPQDEFYQVSKNLVDPDVVRRSWQLEVGGRVKQPRTYSFAEIAALPATAQETTLLCISYGIGSGLCSNARWKGVALRELLGAAIPDSNVAAVLFHAADGYYETFDFHKAMEPTTLLAYEMNGLPLPQRHGFPLRMIVPGRYGEKNPKWITRIELLDVDDERLHRRHGYGFYKEQGWGPIDVVPTHSRIDAPLVDGGGFHEPFRVGQPVEFRGMAFGGDRGIIQVEISTDGGQTYAPAEIDQPGTKISWSLWRYAWTPTQAADEVRVFVRAVDGEGTPQIEEYRDQVPHGATGLHWVRGTVKA